MPAPEKAELDHLLAHAGWARALARSLVRDSNRADDLVQQTWMAALEHPPESKTPIRRWLAAVMRNFARQDARAEKRRHRREEHGARHEALPPHDALEDEVDLQRTLLEAVRALDEPYRSTIWARYYEGLAPRAIAARDGVPLKTVKTRLHRGLNELRLRFDRDHGGDRSAWLAALMPLAKPPSLSATTLGALLVSTELKVACGLVAIVGAIAVWRFSIDASAIHTNPPIDIARPAPALESEPRREPTLEAFQVEGSRAPLEIAKSTPLASTATATDPNLVLGRVLDLQHKPVAGLAISMRTDLHSEQAKDSERVLDVVSGHDGRFELASPRAGFELGVHSDAWVDVYAALLWSEKTHPDVTIFVAPRRPLAGVVVDGARHGIAHADVEIILDEALRRDLGAVLDANIALGWRMKTDAQGHFELNGAPLAASHIAVRAVGWLERSIDPPTMPTYDLEIALEHGDKPRALVRGRVFDSEHVPLEGVYVALGPETCISRADGAFEFDLDAMKWLDQKTSNGDGTWRPEFDARSIVAAKPGYLPARITIPAVDELRREAAGSETAGREVELVLGARPLEIRGRVVDTEGHAVPNVSIHLRGETVFGAIPRKTDTAEIRMRTTTEALLRGDFSSSGTTSADDGAFVIPGLLDKEYGLLALDKRTLRTTSMGNVRAGSSDVVIRMPSEQECVRVAGRVVSLAGDPIVGVGVHVGRRQKGEGLQESVIHGSSTETDEQGRFEFAKLVRDDLDFQVAGQTIFILLGWQPKSGDPLDDLTITVSRRCHVRIDLGAKKDFADRAIAIDDKGHSLTLLKVQGDVSWSPTEFSIVDGRSEPLACEETARTIVLFSGEKEVERVPFTPKPGELVVVRP